MMAPLEAMISETTGKMIRVSNTVILEAATCEGICIKNCPRAHHFFWREAWLKRVEEPTEGSPVGLCCRSNALRSEEALAAQRLPHDAVEPQLSQVG